MNSWLIDPRYFSAYAAAAEGDADLPKGTHLRLFPSSAIAWPLAPFMLWTVDAEVREPAPFVWFARNGRLLATPDLDEAGGEIFGWRQGEPPGDARLIGVEARFRGGEGEIALLDRSGERVLSARSAQRWLVAAPQITRLRVRGRGRLELQGWSVSAGRSIERLFGSAPFGTLSAPILGDRPWYAGGEGPEVAQQRVAEGAPRRWTPPDRPDGPFDALSPAAEQARVAAFQATLDDEFEQLVGDKTRPPASVFQTHLWPSEVLANGQRRPWQQAREQILGTLLMKAMDPGAGRYLGLMAALADLPPPPANPFLPSTARAWLAAGLFACGPEMRFELPDPDGAELRLIERLSELQPGVREVMGRVANTPGLSLRAFVAPALAAPPPDRQAPPLLVLGDAGWQREEVGVSHRFRQQLRIEAPALGALVALGRQEQGAWATRHELIDLAAGADPAQRAATQLLGSATRLRDGQFGVVTNNNIDAEGAPWLYRVALSDLFGRFGEPADISVPEPARPAVPQPTLRAQMSLAERAVGDDPAVAGSVRFDVAVPALADMSAGSRALARVLIEFDGAVQDAPAPPDGGTLKFDFNLPALMPMETRAVTATARFEDDQGAQGTPASLTLDVADPRSPPVPRTGIGIVWTSRPAPATDVEIRLRFTGVAGARYRAYLSDTRGLDIAPMAGDRPRTRAEMAVEGAQRGLAGVGLRDRFRLLTEPPLVPGADGSVLFETRLPRALQTVQFLRLVPLSARNAEAAFESCPLLPIAVPSDHRPPAPRVQAIVDAVRGVVALSVHAQGLNLPALQAAEPGLFEEPPAADAVPPEFRLRRATGAVPDDIYAREIARGALQRQGGEFAAVLEDPTPLSPYVRTFYWAEVRLPAERRLPPGMLEVALPAGAIEPAQPAQRQDAPAAFSARSAPAMAVLVPEQVPDLLAAVVAASVGAGGAPGRWRLSLQISGAPVVSARAVGSYRVRLHLQLDGGDWAAEAGEAELVDGALTLDIERAGVVVPLLSVALVLVDPIGREAAPLMLDALEV